MHGAQNEATKTKTKIITISQETNGFRTTQHINETIAKVIANKLKVKCPFQILGRLCYMSQPTLGPWPTHRL